jgi:membrane protein implicated in regulation of membrane protease activity
MRRYSSAERLAHALWFAAMAATYTFILGDHPRVQLGLIAALTFSWVAVDRRARREAKEREEREARVGKPYGRDIVWAVAASHIEEGEAVVYREDGKVEAAK